MNRKTLISLVLVFILMATVVTLQGIRRAVEPAPLQPTVDPVQDFNREVNRLFPELNPEDIYAVNIQDPLTRISLTLVNAPQGWTALETTRMIDQRMADTVAVTVAEMPYSHVLTDIEPGQYAEFGLTRDALYLVVSVITVDETNHTIAIGGVTPDSAGHYVLVDNRREMYVVEAAPIAYLTTQLRAAANARPVESDE